MANVRKTKQRQAILTALNEAIRPLSASEIYENGRRSSPGLGIRTVYRFIHDMVEEGKLVGLDYPGQPPRFELVHRRHHPHFICRKCKKLFDFKKETSDVTYDPPAGFIIEGQEVTFYGTCPSCLGTVDS